MVQKWYRTYLGTDSNALSLAPGSQLLCNTVLSLGEGQLGATEFVASLLLGALFVGFFHGWVSTDGSVCLLVELLKAVTTDTILDVASKLPLVLVRVAGRKVLHVISNVTSEDVFAKDFGIEGLGFAVITNETLFRVRDINTTINGSLHGSKDTVASGGAAETNIEKGTERTRTIIERLNEEIFSNLGSISLSSILISKTNLGQVSAGTEQSSCIGSSIVG